MTAVRNGLVAPTVIDLSWFKPNDDIEISTHAGDGSRIRIHGSRLMWEAILGELWFEAEQQRTHTNPPPIHERIVEKDRDAANRNLYRYRIRCTCATFTPDWYDQEAAAEDDWMGHVAAALLAHHGYIDPPPP